MKRAVRVVELFAGVGGFRIGLERASARYRTVWNNQWEPATRRQVASAIYRARFGDAGHSNVDITGVAAADIPDHDLLVGGFPCQDYSVARSLNSAGGLQGKKGVLFWEIHRILREKRPPHLMLENVDRMLKSPARQRGRDLAVMLASLSDLGYAVEWRVVNAAEHGMPQRRKRVFIMGHLQGTAWAKAMTGTAPSTWLASQGPFAKAFPARLKGPLAECPIQGDLAEITAEFNSSTKGRAASPFLEAGVMLGRQVFSTALVALYKGPSTLLGDVLIPEKEVPAAWFIPKAQEKAWAYLKGSKAEERTNRSTGFKYRYMEGAMTFPDDLQKPARTVITAEGGTAPSRFKHVVRMGNGRLRRLLPVELERLNMFPDGHTEGASDTQRAFLMGNALVTGVVERLGKTLLAKLG
jgi:DNA (cytosine-5)-methyltransferase 1